MKTKRTDSKMILEPPKRIKMPVKRMPPAVRQMASTLHLNDLLITYTPLMNKAQARISRFIFLNRSVRTSDKRVDLVIAQDA